jgi:hypothetical protein
MTFGARTASLTNKNARQWQQDPSTSRWTRLEEINLQVHKTDYQGQEDET